MAIDSSALFTLMAAGESAVIDFKSQAYGKENAEFAKDVMAIANSLGAGVSVGYILLGVGDDGELIGLTDEDAKFVDDERLHEMMKRLLNRIPSFIAYKLQADDRTIGVIEIRGGKRPFFPIVERNNTNNKTALSRHVPLYRNGPTTDIASPDMVIEWTRQGEEAELLRRQKEKLEADVAIHAKLEFSGIDPIVGQITNRSHYPVVIEDAEIVGVFRGVCYDERPFWNKDLLGTNPRVNLLAGDTYNFKYHTGWATERLPEHDSMESPFLRLNMTLTSSLGMTKVVSADGETIVRDDEDELEPA